MLDFENAESWNILVVDDDEDNLSIASDTLGLFGITVHTAENGEAGLDAIYDIRPTFVLLDLSMPVKDGWETLIEIRQNPEYADMPVIALTAHAMIGDKERAMEAGFDGYITKPFNIGTVLNEIKTCLEHFVTTHNL